MGYLHIAVGVLVSGSKVLIAKRPSDKHQGGKWEFPGGKVESGESVEQALVREFKEEVNLKLDATRLSKFSDIQFDYDDLSVHLDCWLTEHFEGQAKGLEGQEVLWAEIEDLQRYIFPKANLAIIEQLQQKMAD